MPGTLIRLAGEFAVCRLGPTEPVPGWVGESGFVSVTRTDDELSILCPAADVPATVRQERGWRLLKLQGTFAFTETGVLLRILRPLAAAHVGILALSTFDTDYVAVKGAELTRAEEALVSAGYLLR